jgi:hypothetical protein
MEWRTTTMNWRMNTSSISHANSFDVNGTPALEGGARGTPPSTLRQLTRFVARGTLARPGRFARPDVDNNTSPVERIRGMARSQMAAQSRLMAKIAVSNELICRYLNVGLAWRTGNALAGGAGC